MFRKLLPHLRTANLYHNSWKNYLSCQRYYRGRWTPLARRPTFGEMIDHMMPNNLYQVMDRNMREMEQFLTEWSRRSERNFEVFDKRFSSQCVANESITHNDKVFEVKLDVKHFAPEELHIKVVGNRIKVAGEVNKTEENGSYVQRTYLKELTIPENVNEASLETMLSDGILVIRGEVDPKLTNGRTLNIKTEESTPETETSPEKNEK
ncbi:DgyrCDS5117 [Dimorphilus gyrociliatus]|uniref:DgyrCDS5117 n=1 Tax=Dimorphilus gyrociliatus TaxID=2664684 RepID=A0A7I8VKH2_9ANNE|nr:DgyrCDS5117 [Dimorphilus gyrociliatus]